MSMMRARGQNKARHREPIVANEEAFSYFVHSVTFFWWLYALCLGIETLWLMLLLISSWMYHNMNSSIFHI